MSRCRCYLHVGLLAPGCKQTPGPNKYPFGQKQRLLDKPMTALSAKLISMNRNARATTAQTWRPWCHARENLKRNSGHPLAALRKHKFFRPRRFQHLHQPNFVRQSISCGYRLRYSGRTVAVSVQTSWNGIDRELNSDARRVRAEMHAGISTYILM